MKARQIELKTLPADKDAEEPETNYRTMLLGQLNRIEQSGLTYSEIEKRLELRKSLKASNGTWLLDEPAWQQLKTLIEGSRWLIVSDNIAQFIRDVLNAPEVTVDTTNTTNTTNTTAL